MIIYSIALLIIGFVMRNRSEKLTAQAIECPDEDERAVLLKAATKSFNHANIYFVLSGVLMLVAFFILIMAD